MTMSPRPDRDTARAAVSGGTLKEERARRTRLVTMGLDGLAMLAASLVVMAGSGGLLFLWCLRLVVVRARHTPCTTAVQGWRVVPGVCLGRAVDPSPDFQARLARAQALPPGPILVLGGQTSRHHPLTEAAVGTAWLRARGLPAETLHEEGLSRNTLENLRAVRDRVAGQGDPPILISNRYHLARISMMANGLHLDHRLCAAEETFVVTPSCTAKMVLEAFFLHWYIVGRTVARVLRHRGMLGRIT